MEDIIKINIDGYEVGIYSIEYLTRIKGLYGFIYITTNLINGKMYIGQKKSKNDTHWKGYLGSGVALKRAIKKYGKENFDRKIIDIAFNAHELNYLEYFYTQIFDVVKKESWYNQCYGGNATFSESFYENGINQFKKKVHQYDLNLKFLNEFNSIVEAAKHENIDATSISHCCVDNHNSNKDYSNSYMGSIWCYAEDKPKPANVYSKKILKLDKNMNIITVFNTFIEAADGKRYDRKRIADCCYHRIDSYKGYIYMFENEYYQN